MTGDLTSALEALLTGVSFRTLVEDGVTVTHLLAMAVALGSVVANDLMMLRYATRPVTYRLVETLCGAHKLIGRALIVLWISGIALIGLRTGFVPEEISPKLIAKLITVTMLTMTAVLMARAGLPLLARSVGLGLLDIPVGRKAVLAVCAGLSTGGWIAALLLGGSSFLKTAEMGPVLAFTLTVQGVALMAMLAAAMLGRIWRIAAHGRRPEYRYAAE